MASASSESFGDPFSTKRSNELDAIQDSSLEKRAMEKKTVPEFFSVMTYYITRWDSLLDRCEIYYTDNYKGAAARNNMLVSTRSQYFDSTDAALSIDSNPLNGDSHREHNKTTYICAQLLLISRNSGPAVKPVLLADQGGRAFCVGYTGGGIGARTT